MNDDSNQLTKKQALGFLDTAAWHQQKSAAAIGSLAKAIRGGEIPQDDLSQPQEDAPTTSPPVALSVIRIPFERNSEITKVYGKPAKKLDHNLDWFQWPDGVDARLYDRDGSHMVDHDKDDLGRDDHRTNKLLADEVTEILAALYLLLGHDQFIKEGWHVWGGSHKYRNKTAGSTLSTHAWAAALDFNPTENPFRATKTTFSDQALDLWERHGWIIGGRCWGKDPMHIQKVYPRHISKGSYYAEHGIPKWIKKAA